MGGTYSTHGRDKCVQKLVRTTEGEGNLEHCLPPPLIHSMSGEVNKLCSSSLCSFLDPPVTSSLCLMS
jgi:hypothetical protein